MRKSNRIRIKGKIYGDIRDEKGGISDNLSVLISIIKLIIS